MDDEIVGWVTGEDLLKWREVCIEHSALGHNPTVFSKEETIDIVRRSMEMASELVGIYAKKYDEDDDTRMVEIHPDSGKMVARGQP